MVVSFLLVDKQEIMNNIEKYNPLFGKMFETFHNDDDI